MEGNILTPARRSFLSPNWRMKAVLPIAALLVLGLLVFGVITIETPGRHGILLVAAAGAVAICAALLVVLAVLIQQPLSELNEQIARVRQGDLTVSVRFARRDDEIGELGRRFNDMVRQLRESREELERLHRTQMTRAEHFAMLGELAAGLAHEIRNPLAGIAGVVEMIGRDLPPDSQSGEILKEVQREVRHIQNLLSELLKYARPKAPRVLKADLNATAEQAVALARQQILSRPIQIEFEPDRRLPLVDHDPAQIEQVLLNLLLNAIQAIQGAGQVRVQVSIQDNFALVRVSDTGRGIDPSHLPNIFRPFFTTKSKGTGLGLSVARAIVEEHGGQIEASSTPGQGTEFTVRLQIHGKAEPARAGVREVVQ